MWEAFPEGVIKVQGCREGDKCRVSEKPGWPLSVKGDELSLYAAGHRLGSLLLLLRRKLLLLLLLWATRGSHLGTQAQLNPNLVCLNEAQAVQLQKGRLTCWYMGCWAGM